MHYKKILFLTLIFFAAPLFSHPHLFIKPSARIIVNGALITGVEITWEWDEYWSRDVIRECDKNRDGVFNAEETAELYKDFFSNVKDYNYFTEIHFKSKKIKISTVRDFRARIRKDGIVLYSFVVPVNLKLEGTGNMRMRISDETIFIAFEQKLPVAGNCRISGLKISNYNYYGVQASFDVAKK